LQTQLSAADRRKLEEYMSSVRDIELRNPARRASPPAANPDYPQPAAFPPLTRSISHPQRSVGAGVPDRHDADLHIRLRQRIEQSPYPWIGVRDGHHDLSHHQRNAAKQAKIRDINLFHVTQFAYLINRLNTATEGSGKLLDNCMVTYGCGNSDGDRHNHDDLPTLLVGRGRGTIGTGRHVRFARGTPITNLWRAMASRVG